MLVLFIACMVVGIGAIVSILAPYSSYGRIVSNLLAPVYGSVNNVFAYFAERAGSYAFYEVEEDAVMLSDAFPLPGKTYYIYCDNDTRQYFYNDGGTLKVSEERTKGRNLRSMTGLYSAGILLCAASFFRRSQRPAGYTVRSGSFRGSRSCRITGRRTVHSAEQRDSRREKRIRFPTEQSSRSRAVRTGTGWYSEFDCPEVPDWLIHISASDCCGSGETSGVPDQKRREL